MPDANPFEDWADYWVDWWQRSILCLDVLRQRGNHYEEQRAKIAPNVLDFGVELICDGRDLARPVNYLLVRVLPPKGVKIDPVKPPFVVVDPRAGHGPGIGGMKQASEIGVAMAAGHACYFIGFLPEPVPGQTMEDVWEAEAAFVDQVAKRHPEADGKPVVVANCQAGWQTMIMAALHPELTGPILLAGSPLSYWAGTRGNAPMRYLGGLLGGTWLTMLAGDLGFGIFDGANLVANFESLHPDNSWWTKPYNVFSKVDTEAPRFLEFETWWGSPVLLNAGEMQWITDNLFVGNKLTAGQLRTSNGVRIDLRNIRAPVVIFCSWGDDITPPPQALGWITDLYENEGEIAAAGKTIVYCLHESIGHLGIFVSGKVATKEHSEFASCISMIDLMPPGLYEAVITEAELGSTNAPLIEGGYLFRLEPRKIDDIRALGGNAPEDDLRFATAARISEANKALYETTVRPMVQSLASPAMSEWMRSLHPNRLRFAAFSDRNPWMQLVAHAADAVRLQREPARNDNLLHRFETDLSSAITDALKAFGKARDSLSETLFLQTYGSPLLQALAGLSADNAPGGPRVERDLVREADQAQERLRLQQSFEEGGMLEACIRALVYVRLSEGVADERAFNQARKLQGEQPEQDRVTKTRLKDVLKDQSALLAIDPERAVRAIPRLLPAEAEQRQQLLERLQSIITAPGQLSPEGRRRMERVESLFAASNGHYFATGQHA